MSPSTTADSQERPRLSRDRILASALAIIDAEGLEALTMRALGRRLDVEAMSIYRYFPNKAALLEAVGEAVVAEIALPPADAAWEDMVRRCIGSFWKTLQNHPNAVSLLTATPMLSEAAMSAAELLLERLSREGLGADEGHEVFRVLQAFTIGMATMALARLSAEEVERRAAEIDDLDEQHPWLAQALPAAARATPDRDFELGLNLLVRALRDVLEAPGSVRLAATRSEREAAVELRRRVFVEEQGIPASEEADGLDDEAVHVVVLVKDEVAATGRLVTTPPGVGVLARIAVSPKHRSNGLGRRVVRGLEAAARRRGIGHLELHPHDHLESFYAEFGYDRVPGTATVGEHRLITMAKKLTP
ncbi:MAG: GNAT family N-acetyltransferase [Acidobacteriota bacterium]|nr:GNAT family N-acetyltransferase [Acidobacteriota bacterium]